MNLLGMVFVVNLVSSIAKEGSEDQTTSKKSTVDIICVKCLFVSRDLVAAMCTLSKWSDVN